MSTQRTVDEQTSTYYNKVRDQLGSKGDDIDNEEFHKRLKKIRTHLV
jgi:hypothetical protein